MFDSIAVLTTGVTTMPWWNYEILGNTIGGYILSFGVFVGLLVLFRIFQRIIINRLHALAKKTATDIDDTLIEIVQSVRPPFYSFVALYGAVRFLELSEIVQKIFTVLLIVWIAYQVIIAFQIFIEYLFTRVLQKDDEPSTKGALSILKNIAKGALWVGALMMVLSNLGVDITALVAGLGIGGIAIAFAFQNILEDLFSSFAILFDKPFQIGDFIVVGDKMGVVEKIGIKTTRIRSLQGEEVVISNRELTTAQLQNFKKMEERRVVFSIGLTYETPTEKLRWVPGIIKNIIENVDGARFDRSHFQSFGDFALTFETVYYVETGDYNQYMDIQQDINFKIREALEKDNIDMAYPTQTIYLQK
jgi:small-conductance mechanosensitive channel